MENTIVGNGTCLYYKIEGNGPLLLLIHGVACDSNYFDRAVPLLIERFTVLVYDRRGYSRSRPSDLRSMQEMNFSIRIQAEDAARLIKEQKAGAAFVVGCSAGGVIAFELAKTYPELVRGLFLQEPPFIANVEIEEKMSRWLLQLRSAVEKNSMNQAMLLLKSAMGGIDEKAKSKSLETGLQDLENYKIFLYKEMEEFLTYYLYGDYDKQNFQIEEKIDKLKVPCVMAAGKCDCDGLFAQAAVFAAEYLECRLLRTPGYHNFPADRPREFAQMVTDIFLKNIG
ncbi:MAG: alpha/beta hydrolase [Lachnospiraceae bacterium]